ncbi:uncharacterized protein LOC105173893 isoform X3 [Sesamum indicum]|uniref:Uncharacterized protein LOC105173893 isoform X3 n=1 Tax=Sesamum indicum TaxID=4182 RepID=A0A8M8VBU6_SESIN|nr:uncharacterized protein LOC105173893 isoform X3 [Sesamum indicum]
MQLLHWQTEVQNTDAKLPSLLSGTCLLYVSDFMKQQESPYWMPGTNNPENCSILHQYHLDGCDELHSDRRKRDDDLCSLNCARNFSQLSTSSTMCQDAAPTFVYRRRRQRRSSVSMCSIQTSAGAKPSDDSHSAISSAAPSVAAQEHIVSFSECATEAVAASFNRCSAGEEALVSDVDRVINVCCANDNCSSSKSNLALSSVSLKIDMDDVGECSSSGALSAEKVSYEMSERDICISIIRNQGPVDRVGTRQERDSSVNTCIRNDIYYSQPCKICEHLDSTSNMLICDNCLDAFHMSCCNPCIKRIPVGEWLCTSCSKKRHKILKEKSFSISSEIGNGNSASEGELGSTEFMFTDTEPYMSNVRIGDEFQADVPDWSNSSPTYKMLIMVSEGMCLDSFQERNYTKPLKLSSIGNWLQCQGLIEGIGEGGEATTCGKWRRAPLFEVQTDDWECFCCVLWDPSHADCAVPQELDTEEVMRQLKYIEMHALQLRPQLAAKRRKLNFSKRP